MYSSLSSSYVNIFIDYICVRRSLCQQIFFICTYDQSTWLYVPTVSPFKQIDFGKCCALRWAVTVSQYYRTCLPLYISLAIFVAYQRITFGTQNVCAFVCVCLCVDSCVYSGVSFLLYALHFSFFANNCCYFAPLRYASRDSRKDMIRNVIEIYECK